MHLFFSDYYSGEMLDLTKIEHEHIIVISTDQYEGVKCIKTDPYIASDKLNKSEYYDPFKKMAAVKTQIMHILQR